MQRELEYVYAVYQTRSFSKAAKFLYASQPAVSMAVQRVEEDLGFPVFDRQAHPLQLTEAGEMFIRHVERIRESEKTLRSEIDRTSGSEEKSLRIGCSPLKASYLIPEIIARFRRMEPDISIQIVNSFRRGMLRDLQDHKVDIAINTFLDTDNSDYLYIPACEIHYLLGVPADLPVNERLRDAALSGKEVSEGKHLSRSCPHVPLSEFAETPFIEISEGTELYEQSRRIFAESGIRLRGKVAVSSPVLAHGLALKGVGAAIVGDYLVSADSPLRYYHLRTKWERISFYFVLRKDHELLPHQKLFIDLVREYMKERGEEENP